MIFTSLRTESDDGYDAMSESMMALVAEQPGFFGVESACDSMGITLSCWQDLTSIMQWKVQAEQVEAQALGRQKWYGTFKTRHAVLTPWRCLLSLL